MLSLLEAAIETLGLRCPMPPWSLGEPTVPLPTRFNPVLAAPCPLPYDLDEDQILQAFHADERASVCAQIDAAYDTLLVAPIRWGDETAPCVRVQLGVPLVGRDRVFLRVWTANDHGDPPRLVNGNFFAWLTPDGSALFPVEPGSLGCLQPWAVGRSPGLAAATNLNTASPEELSRIRGLRPDVIAALITRRTTRPLASVTELLEVPGVGAATLERVAPFLCI